MKKRVYIEATIVSYLTANPSRDLVRMAHQEVTREWWENHRTAFNLCTSQIVMDEAAKGDMKAASLRLATLRSLPLLEVTDEAEDLGRALILDGPLPQIAVTDALHIAVATVHKLDLLLTWNCRHLANGPMLVEVSRFIRAKGYEIPIVCTPDELLESSGD